MFLDIGLFLIGLTVLYFAADALVEGAGSMALRLGITPLIVGLTVVAFGTSAPELVVSLAAVITDSDDISVGNIIGSNIANLALILGLSAMIRPIVVHTDIIKREYPVMLATSVLLAGLMFDGTLGRVDGLILLACMVGYLGVMANRARTEISSAKEDAESLEVLEEIEDIDPAKSTTAKDLAKVVFGIIGLTIGAKLMVDSAVVIATSFGVPQLVIGITIVAIGTSLPELATSVVAAYRNESDISVGNVIGSNIFNILSVLGIVAAISPITVGGDALKFDLWVMIGVALVIWPVMWTGKRISRIEGGLFLAAYIAYSVWLFLR